MPSRPHPLLLCALALLAGCAQPSPLAEPTQQPLFAPGAPPAAVSDPAATPTVETDLTPCSGPDHPRASREACATPLPTLSAAACQSEAGEVWEKQLASTLLPRPLVFRVYLPPCYGRESMRRYGALYLIHGLQSGAEQWQELGVDSVADRLIQAGQIPPLIIVLPQDESYKQPEEDPFGEALVSELVPWIDGQYRTYADRAHRAVGGLSRGGGWAVHLGFNHPEVFGAVGAHSLPLFWSDAGTFPTLLARIPVAQMPRVYLDIGVNDHEVQGAADFEALLTARGIPHEWHLNQGYHDAAYWSSHLEQYLRFYTTGW
ncbi:MAG TPA: alpha/beta hydrolase-fold protein [Anaerolineaceae bacterium]|nr:alpha/beta hydrolase-fold protein [Anaerolineaceae bacterium]